MRCGGAHLLALAAALALTGCGAGSGEQVQSAPAPIAAPTLPATSTPVSTPAAVTTNYDTAEYRASSGPAFHGAITAYEKGASGAGVLVGIVDTGIADADGEFTDRISPLSRDFAGNATFTDVGGHGTAVAETLAGARNDKHVQGMAWAANILALRTDKPGSCATSGCESATSAMAQAVDYASQKGARIVNISLGGDTASPELMAAVSRATSAGTIVVIAAGNNKTGEAPSASPNALAASVANPAYSHGLVIVATSVGSDGLVSSFSNGAKGYETSTLSALGDSVRTIDNKGTDLLYTGTSLAAPQISGAAALLAQAFPSLSSAQIVQLLLTTARDAGTSGPDAAYGMGILDVARAFQPQGQLSLAGSSTPLSTTDTTLLSSVMGDAAPAGLGAVVLDGYRRPYRTDLSLGMERPALGNRLTSALALRTSQLRGDAGPLSLSLNLAPARSGFATATPLDRSQAAATRARFLSGTIRTGLSPQTSLALGFRADLETLEQDLDGVPHAAFLVADGGAGTLASELRASSSMAMRQRLGRGFALVSGVEIGGVDGLTDRPGMPGWRPAQRETRYQALLSGLSYDRGRIGFRTALQLVNEEGSLLGARLAPALGGQSARSLFASAGVRFQPLPGLMLDGSMQRGWTYAQAGGALTDGGLLRTRSWSLDLTRAGLLVRGDLLGLRVSAPQRVTSSRFALALPQSWDWQSGIATLERVPIDLAPRGSERDYELSYGRSVSAGWLAANLFVRKETGNIAAMPDDLGAALRWSARF